MTTKIFVLVRNPSGSEKLFPPIPQLFAGYKFSIEEYQEEDWVTKAEDALARLHNYLESGGQEECDIVIRCESETIFDIARAITCPYKDVRCVFQDDDGEVVEQPLEGGRMGYWPKRSDFFVTLTCLDKILMHDEEQHA